MVNREKCDLVYNNLCNRFISMGFLSIVPLIHILAVSFGSSSVAASGMAGLMTCCIRIVLIYTFTDIHVNHDFLSSFSVVAVYPFLKSIFDRIISLKYLGCLKYQKALFFCLLGKYTRGALSSNSLEQSADAEPPALACALFFLLYILMSF